MPISVVVEADFSVPRNRGRDHHSISHLEPVFRRRSKSAKLKISDLAGLDATGTDTHPFGGSLYYHASLLDICPELPAVPAMRVTYAHAKSGALATHFTNCRHTCSPAIELLD